MSSNFTLNVHINPLQFLKGDEPGIGDSTVTAEDVLQFLCAPETPHAPADLLARYRKINSRAPHVFVAPQESRLLDRLVWPLRHAKGSFMVGNYLGTIALCGLVAEMVAMLIFETAGVQLNGLPLDKKQQERLFGRSFEKLGQERRVDVLRSFGMITEAIERHFDSIRNVRRNYLHLWSADHNSSEEDAIVCFDAATRLVIGALGLTVKDGTLVLREEIVKYLRQHGIISAESA
jgi:hypothetical protein